MVPMRLCEELECNCVKRNLDRGAVYCEAVNSIEADSCKNCHLQTEPFFLKRRVKTLQLPTFCAHSMLAKAWQGHLFLIVTHTLCVGLHLVVRQRLDATFPDSSYFIFGVNLHLSEIIYLAIS